MAYDKHTGINRLAQVMSARIKKEAKPTTCFDFGSVDSGYNLQTDTFPELIPKSAYFLCRSLTIGKTEEEFAKVLDAEKKESEYVVPVPEKIRSLLPGDRVLVAWIGATAVVIDILVSAEALGAEETT